MAVGGDRCSELDDHDEWILIVALESERLAIGAFHFLDNEIGVQLDAHAAGGFHGLEVNFCGGGNGLPDGVQGRGDIVVRGEETCGAGNLRMERHGGTKAQGNEKQGSKEHSAAGHRTPFKYFRSEPVYIYRIPNPSLRVAFSGGEQAHDFIGGPFDGSRRPQEAAHFF